MVRVKNVKVGVREYVEFKIKKPTTFTLNVTAVLPPFEEDPSGNPVSVSGAKFTQVMFSGLRWTCSIAEVKSVKPIIKDFESVGQFEGVIGYVIGRRASAHYLTTQTVNCAGGSYRCVRVWYGP